MKFPFKNYFREAKTDDKRFPYLINSSVKEVFELFTELNRNGAENNFCNSSKRNLLEHRYLVGSDRPEWFQFSSDQFIEHGNGQFPMELFNKEKNKLKDLRQKLQETLAPIGKVRRRKFSEQDGEYSVERQWEIQPFAATFKENTGILPTIKITVDTSFSAGNSAQGIANYAAFCWAIIDTIENAGVSCEVNIQNTCYMLAQGKVNNRQCRFVMNAKKAGEYTDTMNLARAFTPAFLRRGIFLLKYSYAETHGCGVTSGISQPMPEEKPFSSSGELYLSFQNKTNDIEKLSQEILRAVKGEN